MSFFVEAREATQFQSGRQSKNEMGRHFIIPNGEGHSKHHHESSYSHMGGIARPTPFNSPHVCSFQQKNSCQQKLRFSSRWLFLGRLCEVWWHFATASHVPRLLG